MVADDDAPRAGVECPLRVIAADHALDQDRQRRLLHHPFQVVPVERGMRLHVDVLGKWILTGGRRRIRWHPVAEVGVADTVRQAEHVADVALAASGLG